MALFATKKRLMLLLAGAFALLVILGSSAESFFFSPIVSEKVEIYAGSADGDWENAGNAQGLPQVAADDSEDNFSKSNSALYTRGTKELILGEFKATGEETQLKTEDEEIIDQLQEGSDMGNGVDAETEEVKADEADDADEKAQDGIEQEGTDAGGADSRETNESEPDENDLVEPEEGQTISQFLKNLLAFKPASAEEKKDLATLKAETHVVFARVKASMAILPAALEEMETVKAEDSVSAEDVPAEFAAGEETVGDETDEAGVAENDTENLESDETGETREGEGNDGGAETSQENPQENDSATTAETGTSGEDVLQTGEETEAIPETETTAEEEYGTESELGTAAGTTGLDSYESLSQEEVEAAITALGMDIDAKVLVSYSLPAADGADNWQVFETITQDSISNKQNGGYFSWEAPFLRNWEDIENLKLKFEGVVDGEVKTTLYLDSVWVEAEYEEGAGEGYLDPDSIAKSKNGWLLHSDQDDWGMNQEPVFILEDLNAANPSLSEKVIQYFNQPEIAVDIVGDDGQKIQLKKGDDYELSDGESAGITKIVLAEETNLEPGKYTLEVTAVSKGTTTMLTEEFTWGVLAINTNKSMYAPGEKGEFAMAVLDEKGEMICDASLTLKIKNREMQTENTLTSEDGGIKVNSEICKSKEFTLEPDYESSYEFEDVGTYELTLTAETANGIHEITDSVEVKNDISFDVERISATRIYPLHAYPVTLEITARQDFDGEIIETVPDNFEVSEGQVEKYRAYDSESTENGQRILKWKLSIQAGDSVKLGYQYDAPDDSPAYYLLGPLKFVDKNLGLSVLDKIVFEEAREWQIAVDSIAASYATRLYTTGFERNSVTANHEITGTSGTAPTISSSTYRSGSYALGTNASSATSMGYIDIATADTGTTRTIARAYIRVASLPSQETQVLVFYDGTAPGTSQASIRLDGSGNLKVYNEEDGTQVGSTLTGAVSTNTWYRLELKYDFGTAATGNTAIAGMIDGNIFASSTTENHANGARRLVMGVITSNTTGEFYWDDIGVNQDSAVTVDNWVGEGKVVMLLPDGVNSPATPWDNNGGTNILDSVDDSASGGFDDGSGYVDCSTNTTSSTNDFTLADTSSVGIAAGDKIRIVEGWARSRSTSTSSSSHVITNVSTGNDASGNNTSTSTSWFTNSNTVPRNAAIVSYDIPGSANYGEITPALVDGLSLRLTTADCNPEHQVTAVWALVEYVSEGGRLWSSGFELQNTPINNEEWDTVAGTLDISTSTKRSGDASARVQSLSSGTEESVTETIAASNSDGAFFFRTYLNIATAPATNSENRIFEFKDSGGTARAYVTLSNSSDGNTQSLKLYDEDGQVGSASSDLNTGQWYRVEVKFDSSGTGATDTIEARIDGTNFATSSTRDLTNGVTQIVLGGNLNSEAQTTGEWFFDDVALNVNAGSTQNSYPGSGKIVHLRPNGDGDTLQWTGSYADLDDTDPDEATTRAYISTVNYIEDVSLYDASTVGISSGDTIKLVSAGARFNTSASATMAFNVRMKDTANAPVLKSAPIVSTGTTWYTNKNAAPRPYPITAYTRPFSNTSWTASDLDSTQLSVQELVDTTSNIQVTALWLLVEYDPALISISGTSDMRTGSTVRVAINGSLDSANTGTINASTGNWIVSNVVAASGNSVIAFVEDSDSNESTAITTYDGSGNIEGMVLNQNVLSIGNSDNRNVAFSDIDDYQNSASGTQENVMHTVSSSVLTVDDDNVYSAEKINVLSGNTLTVSGTETVTTYDLSFTGAITSGGSSSYNVAHDFTAAGTFTASTSTIVFNGSTAQTFTTNGATYNVITLNNTGTDGSNDNVTISGALDVNGAFNITNGDLVLTSGNPNVNTAGDVTIGSSAFVTKGSGTWTFDGGTQALTDSSTGGPQDLGAVTIGPSSTTTVNTASAITASSVTVGGDDTLNITDDTLYLTGTGSVLTVNTGGTFTQTGATVNFAGSSSQNIPALNFNNLTSSSSGARTLASSGTIGIAGTFTPGTNSYTITGSTIDFNGSSSQTIPAFNYNNLKSGAPAVERTGNVGDIQDGGNTGSQSVTVPSDATIAIVAVACSVNSTGYYTNGTVTLDGQSMTLGRADDDDTPTSTSDYTAIFYLVNPPTGSRSLSWDWQGTASATDGGRVMYSFYKGVDTISPLGSTGGNQTNTSTANTGSLTATTRDLIVAVAYGDMNPSPEPSFDWTNANEVIDSTYNTSSASYAEYSPSGNTTVTATLSGGSGSSPYTTVSGIVLKATAGTGARTLASSGTIGIAGTFTPGTNSYTITGSTIDFNGGSTQTVNAGFTYNNLQVRPSANSVTSNFAAGTVTVGGNFTAGNGVNTGVAINANANSTTINVSGAFTVSGSTNFTANNSNALTIGGDFSSSGTFTVGGANITVGTDGTTNGDFTLESGSTWTAGAGTLILDGGDNTNLVYFEDKNAVKQNMGNVQIGASPATTNMSSDMSATNLTIASGDRLNTRGYDVTLTGYLTCNGTLNVNDTSETDDTYITLAGNFTMDSGGTYTDDDYDSEIVFTGNASADETFATGGKTYGRVTLNNTQATYDDVDVSGNLTLNGNLTVTDGNLDLEANDPTTDLAEDVSIGSSGTITASSSSSFSVAGSWANGGTLTPGAGTITFDSGDTGETVDAGGTGAGKPFNTVVFNNSAGGWTIQTSDMKAANLTITDVSAWALAASRTIEVTGTYSVANAETTATTWNSGSTLYLNGTSQTVGSKTQNAETYANLQVGADTDIRMWQSSASGTVTVSASGSLYSQDHANTDGDLYIWGDYHVNTNDYWSYANDFDNAAVTRQVDVRIDPAAKVTVDSGDTLNIIGTSGNRTTIDRQGASNGYEMSALSGGTINFEYANFDHQDGALGLDIQAGATVTSLNYTDFDNLVGSAATNDAYITVASSVIGAGTKTITGVNFDRTDTTVEFNVNRTGTDDTGYWDFDASTGTYDGESYDGDDGANEADPGMLRWDDSVQGITISGTVWTNETKTANIGADKTVHLYVNSTDKNTAETNASGVYSFASVSGINANDSVIVYLDGESENGSTVTLAVDGTTAIANLDIFTNHISLEHRTAGPIANTDLDDIDGVDAENEDGITVSAGTATFASPFELYVLSGENYTPGGAVVSDDFEIEGTGTFAPQANSVNVGGDWEMSATGTFTTSGTVTFDGTAAQTIITGGKSFSAFTMSNTGSDGADDNVTISGTLDVNGACNLTNGDLYLSTNNPNITTAGDVTIGALAFVTKGSGTWTFDGASGTHVLTDSSTAGPQDLGAVVIDNGSTGNVVSTASAMKLTTLDITASDTLNITDDTLTISGSGTPFTKSGTFTTTGSTVIYAGTSATNITATAYNNLTLTPASGTVTYSLAGNLTTTNAMTGSLTISTGTTLDATVSSYDISLAGSWANAGTFTHNSNTVTFTGTTTGLTIVDGGSPFYDLAFTGSGGEWLYQNGASTAPNLTTVSAGTPTFLNAKTGSVSVTSGILNVDWYLGAHVVDAVNTGTNINTDDADITIAESSGAATVWRHNGSVWGTPAALQTTGTDSDGKNPQPAAAGAIRVREYSMTASASCPGAGCTLYKYNLLIDWQTSYGEYDYHNDYGENYLTSCWANGATCGNDSSDDDVIGADWYRSSQGTMNTPYDAVNDPPTKGSWYVGMLAALDFALNSFDVDFGTVLPGANPSDATNTMTVTTSASHGYVVYVRASQNMTCSSSAVCAAAVISGWPDGNDAPTVWNNGSFGFGYSTNDTSLQGGVADRFSGPKFAGFDDSPTSFGDPVADRTGPVSGQQNIVTYRLAASGEQSAGPYQAIIVYVVAANY